MPTSSEALLLLSLHWRQQAAKSILKSQVTQSRDSKLKSRKAQQTTGAHGIGLAPVVDRQLHRARPALHGRLNLRGASA
eukprot:COSAG04_NODE_3320_length_2939_cov_9.788028_1_plen_78_part_10